MKRIISISLILCLLLSVFGCKKAPQEDSAAPADVETNVETNAQPDSQSGQEQTPQTNEPEQEVTTEPEPEQKTESEPEPEANPNKAAPWNLTLDNTFSEYEVIVTLTKEETEKNKTYTEKDFEDYDIFYVMENDAYYGNPNLKDSYPEYQDKTTLFLYLNEPSKENVLKTVKKLEKDERIFAACPCPVYFDTKLILYFTNNYSNELMKLASDYEKYRTPEYSHNHSEKYESYNNFIESFEKRIKEDFCYNEVCEYNVYSNSGVINDLPFVYNEDPVIFLPEVAVKISISEEKSDNSVNDTYNALKKYSQDPKIEKIRLRYSPERYTGKIQFKIKNANYDKSNPYTVDDFKDYTNMKILNLEQNNSKLFVDTNDEVLITVTFEKPKYQQLINTIESLKSNPKISNAYCRNLDEEGKIIQTQFFYLY